MALKRLWHFVFLQVLGASHVSDSFTARAWVGPHLLDGSAISVPRLFPETLLLFPGFSFSIDTWRFKAVQQFDAPGIASLMQVGPASARNR